MYMVDDNAFEELRGENKELLSSIRDIYGVIIDNVAGGPPPHDIAVDEIVEEYIACSENEQAFKELLEQIKSATNNLDTLHLKDLQNILVSVTKEFNKICKTEVKITTISRLKVGQTFQFIPKPWYGRGKLISKSKRVKYMESFGEKPETVYDLKFNANVVNPPGLEYGIPGYTKVVIFKDIKKK